MYNQLNSEEEVICELIHNDCHRSIINKFFEFYKINENSDSEESSETIFINKENLIEIFEKEIIAYLNYNNIQKDFNNSIEDKYKLKYYQGMNDLIIFFVLLSKLTYTMANQLNELEGTTIKDCFEVNKEIINLIKSEDYKFINDWSDVNKFNTLKSDSIHISQGDTIDFKFNLYEFLDFVFQRNFKPFCYIKLENITFDNAKLFKTQAESPQENFNSIKIKKILPTVVKYVEIINPLIKRRLFDLTKIDPFYSLSWILTWFSHNNANIFKNFRIIDYLLLGESNTIFYLVAVVCLFKF